MIACPNCGTERVTAVKCWTVSPAKQGANGKSIPEFRVGIFECTQCKSKFRSRVESKSKPAETANVKELVERIKGIREGFMQTLNNLREKIKTLETERADLMDDIERLKKVAESRANALEDEVTQLREEIKNLKELLGDVEEDAT